MSGLAQPIVAVSVDHIFIDEHVRGRKRSIASSITEPVIDSVWHDGIHQLLLLTATKIFAYDRKTKVTQPIADIIPTDNKPFKCFTVLDDQSSLLVAYDEWQASAIERWEPTREQNGWTLANTYPLNLTSNEFIGSILAVQVDVRTALAITIYNHLTEQWRMELRPLETSACLRSILLPETNLQHDYRIINLGNRISTMKWLVYSPMNTTIIVIDHEWRKTYYKHKLPIRTMALMRKGNNVLIQTTNRLGIHTIS